MRWSRAIRQSDCSSRMASFARYTNAAEQIESATRSNTSASEISRAIGLSSLTPQPPARPPVS